MDETIGIIPARYASSRFPGKPLAIIQGKSLLQRTYENAKRCTALTKVVVATDDERIYDHVKSFGGDVVMTSIGCINGTERLAEVYEAYPFLRSEIVVNIQGDEPCVSPKTIEAIISSLRQDPLAEMATAAVLIENEREVSNPNIVKCLFDQNQNALYFSRTMIPANRHGLFCSKTTYYRHLGIYGYRGDFLTKYVNLPNTPLQQIEDLEQLKALEHGVRIKIAIVKECSIGVDVPEDLHELEKILCRQNIFL